MKAVGLYKYLPIDHPESLLDVEIDTPVAAGRDLLVEVKAVSVNPVDTKVRAPRDTVEAKPKILGWDAAGVVKAAGPGCVLFKAGDPVYYAGSRIRQGANCEFHLVDERIVGRKPANLNFAQAAALPLTTLTAWELMFERMGISKSGGHAGRSLLVLGGAGGVGSIAIQLAKKMAKLKVTASASRPETVAWCRELGADDTVDHS
ncbi:MAG: zinc-binding alcohol dehydrogenase family protein, partial [Burkholderiales bacterium]